MNPKHRATAVNHSSDGADVALSGIGAGVPMVRPCRGVGELRDGAREARRGTQGGSDAPRGVNGADRGAPAPHVLGQVGRDQIQQHFHGGWQIAIARVRRDLRGAHGASTAPHKVRVCG